MQAITTFANNNRLLYMFLVMSFILSDCDFLSGGPDHLFTNYKLLACQRMCRQGWKARRWMNNKVCREISERGLELPTFIIGLRRRSRINEKMNALQCLFLILTGI